MAATKKDIERWFVEGKKDEVEFMIVVCDSFVYEYYPVFVKGTDFWKKINEIDKKSMRRIMEVYDLSMDMEFQLDEPRAFHFPKSRRDKNKH